MILQNDTMPHHQQQESTTSTMPASINDLDEILSRKKFWTSDLQFNEEEDDEKEPRFTNVSQVLASQGLYFLPEHFKGSNKQARRKALVAVKLSAIKAGFSLVTRTSMKWRPIKPKTGHFQVVIVLVCSKANEYRATHDKSEENPRRTSTQRPLCNEQLCPFKLRLQVYRNDNDIPPEARGRWILSGRPCKSLILLLFCHVRQVTKRYETSRNAT